MCNKYLAVYPFIQILSFTALRHQSASQVVLHGTTNHWYVCCNSQKFDTHSLRFQDTL